MVDALTWWPSLSSSPRILLYPQVLFSGVQIGDGNQQFNARHGHLRRQGRARPAAAAATRVPTPVAKPDLGREKHIV